jgi:acetyl-CoA acetyltransferase
MSGLNSVRDKVLVAGVGFSEIGRRTGKTEGQLALEACLAAISDAGLNPEDIQGVTSYPDRVYGRGFEGPSISYVQRALGFRETLFWQGLGWGPAQFSSVISATYAIACGGADVVLCYRAHIQQDGPFIARTPDVMHATDDVAFKAPYGVPAGAPRFALWAQRHMYEYGTTAEDLCSVVLTCREHAQLNPRAVWYGHPLTREDYFQSPMVSSPFRILDCDMPVDGAIAFILVAADRASDLPSPAVKINAVGHASGPDLEWDQWEDLTRMASAFVGKQLWENTELTPEDVDCVQLYDGFSWLALCWLEDMGFVEKGEAGAFFREGRGRLTGELPVCTDGGQLGMGRMHGFSKLAEAVLQLRGDCGERQVPNTEVALACAGGGGIGSAILLTR